MPLEASKFVKDLFVIKSPTCKACLLANKLLRDCKEF